MDEVMKWMERSSGNVECENSVCGGEGREWRNFGGKRDKERGRMSREKSYGRGNGGVKR